MRETRWIPRVFESIGRRYFYFAFLFFFFCFSSLVSFSVFFLHTFEIGEVEGVAGQQSARVCVGGLWAGECMYSRMNVQNGKTSRARLLVVRYYGDILLYYLIRSARARSDQEPMTEQMDQTNAIHSKEGVKSDEERKKKIKERRKRRGSHSVCSGGKKKK